MSTQAKADQTSEAVLNEAFSIWKDFDPVEGYAAGLDDCKGKLFLPNAANQADLLRRIEDLKPRLGEIQDADLRRAAGKLLSSVKVSLGYGKSDEQVLNCALAFWYIILKGEDEQGFVRPLLERAVELLRFELSRWSGKSFSGEERKATADGCAFLSSVLDVLGQKNREFAGPIAELSSCLEHYQSLFSPVPDSDKFEEVFAFLEANSAPRERNEAYQDILDELFDYGASAAEILAQSRKMLAEEMNLVEAFKPKLIARFDLHTEAPLGAVYQAITDKYAVSGSVVAEAKTIMKAANRFTDRYIQDLGTRPNILPEAAPTFLKPLITSGATVPLDYLRTEPRVYIYVNEEKNKSWLTLLNVLVHEATHAYHPLILAAEKSPLPNLVKLKSSLSIPFSEATAFHREFELFEAVKEESESQRLLNKVQKQLLAIFDSPRFPLPDDVLAFEFETRVWRIMRALRSICDVQVNCGASTYVSFVNWANEYTGLTKEFIHNECFTFLSYPGYTPSYSFCGVKYEELEKSAAEKHISTLDFNTRSNRMGLWPWTTCVKKMMNFH